MNHDLRERRQVLNSCISESFLQASPIGIIEDKSECGGGLRQPHPVFIERKGEEQIGAEVTIWTSAMG